MTVAFKNAFKIMVDRFGLVWMLLLYIFILAVVLVSVSMAFMIPIYRIFLGGGIIEEIYALFKSIVGGDSINAWFEQIRNIGQSVSDLFAENFALRLNSALWLIIVVVLAYRFLIGLYELQLMSVLELVSKLGKSSRFTLVKMLYTIVFDVIVAIVMYGLFLLLDVSGIAVFAPFLIMLVFIVLMSLRYSFIAMWSPRVIVDGGKIFSSFAFSVKSACKNFGSVFAYFLVAWVIIIALNIFVGLFTLGAGLLISIPVSMLFVSILNMTLYYGKNGKRYYVDGTVITPPYKKEEDKEA